MTPEIHELAQRIEDVASELYELMSQQVRGLAFASLPDDDDRMEIVERVELVIESYCNGDGALLANYFDQHRARTLLEKYHQLIRTLAKAEIENVDRMARLRRMN